MSTKLFAFDRRLPAPFDKGGKKKVKVSSTYGDGTEATLSSTVVKAVLAYCACKDGSKPGAVGICGGKGVAEYKSASGADAYHLAVYDPSNGTVLASKYDSGTEVMETYSMGKSGQDGAAVLLAMIPALAADQEFADNLDAFMAEYRDSFSDLPKATDLAAILCDNAYRRVKDKSCPAHLQVNIDNSGNVMRVSQTHLDSGNFTPDRVLAGEFTILAHTGATVVLEQTETVPHKIGRAHV